jgi:hypothetical protein
MKINGETNITIPLGEIFVTPKARAALKQEEISTALERHRRADWGDVSACAKTENDCSAVRGYRVGSIYYSTDGAAFYVVTLGDRSKTYVRLADESAPAFAEK